MDVGVTSAILAGVVSITVAIAVLFRRPRRPLYGYFSAFSFALFFWHAASLAGRIGGSGINPLQYIAAVLIPPTAAFFFRDLLRDQGVASRHLALATIPLSVILLVVSFGPWEHGWWVGGLNVLYVATTLLLIARAMHNRIRKAPLEADRKRLSFLFYGGVTVLILAAGELIPGVVLPSALGHVAVTIYIYFLYQSIVARRLIDLVELLGKAAVLATLSLVLATVYSLLVLWVGEDQQGLWIFNTLVASFVIMIIYDQARPWVEEATVKLLFRQRYELRRDVRELLQQLRRTIGLEEMRERTLDGLVASGRAVTASIYLPAEGELSFALFGSRGDQPPRILSAANHPTLLNELRRERKPILLEHLEGRIHELPTLADGDATSQRELDRVTEAMVAMQGFHATIMLPMLADEAVVGVLTLGQDKSSESYSTEEIAALLSVAEACAVVITNSNEYDRQRQRDRLAAIGEMATGMAHEIRNPLGAIKGAAQCLDPEQLPEDSREFLDVIVEEVDRLNGVVMQFLEYARPYRGNPEPTDVNEVVSATLKLLGRDASPVSVELIPDLALNLPEVSIDPEQLKQVLINLSLNAIQSMRSGGRVTLHTEVVHEHGGDLTGEMERGAMRTHVIIRVTDTGAGIPAEDLSRVFVPFFTTKDNGTGLGLPITQRIVENAGGRLEVASRVGRGTTFTIRLPAVVPELEEQEKEEALTEEPAKGELEQETVH